MRKWTIPLLIALLTVGGAVAFMVLSRPDSRRSGESGASTPAEARPVVSIRPGDPDRPALPASSDAPGSSPTLATDLSAGGPQLHGQVATEDGEALGGAVVQILEPRPQIGNNWERSRRLRQRLLKGDASPASSGGQGALAGGAASRVIARGIADAQGLYSIPIAGLSPGSYDVVASHPTHASRTSSWTSTPESSELSFRLPPGDEISGVVLDPHGDAVAGALVDAAIDGGGFGGFAGRGSAGDSAANHVEADSSGKFSLVVAPGTYRLSAAARGYSRGSVHEIASGSADVEIPLGYSRRIGGTALGAASEPLEGVSVLLFREAGAEAARRAPGENPLRLLRLYRAPDAQATTDAAGKFEAKDLSPGEYVVLARRAGLVPAEHVVELAEDQSSASIDLHMDRGKQLSGRVTDASGHPVHGAFVVVAEDRSSQERDFQGGGSQDPRGGGRGAPGGAGALGGPRDGAPRDGTSRDGTSRDGTSRDGTSRDPGDFARNLERARAEARANPISLTRAMEAVETDADGKFLFDTLPKGAYALSVQMDDFVPHRENGIQLSDPVDLKVALDSGIHLEGQVTSSVGGQPVPKAQLRFEISDDDLREITAGEDGSYSIAGLLAAKIREIEVDAPGFALVSQENVPVAEAPAVQTKDFALTPSSRISGIVSDAKGAPVSRARVTISSAVDESSSRDDRAAQRFGDRIRQQAQSRSGRTDEEGKFTIDEINAMAAIQVTIEHPEFKRFRSDPFLIAVGSERDGLRYTLSAGGRVEVTVVDASRAAVTGARVSLSREPELQPADKTQAVDAAAGQGREAQGRPQRPADPRFGQGRTRLASRQTDQEGKANLAGIEGGNYTLSVQKNGFQPFSASLQVLEDQTLPFPVQLLPENVITGTVQDRFGAPVAGAMILAQKEGAAISPGSSPSAKSDATGAYRVGSLGDGAFTLRVRASGFATKTIAKVEVNTEVPILLERNGGISGVVLSSETGEPVTAFRIRLRDEAQRGNRSQGAAAAAFARLNAQGIGPPGSRSEAKSFTDPGGAFSFSDIAPGSYVLQVTAEGRAGAEARVDVADGAVTEGVQMMLVEGLSVAGAIVQKGTGEPIAGAQVYLAPLREEVEVESQDTSTAADRRDARRAERESRLAARREGEPGRNTAREAEALLTQVGGLAAEAARRGGSSMATSDDAGAFQLKEVPLGRYTLVVTHDAFVTGRVDLAIDADRVARSLQIELDPGESLTGTVALADGTAAGGAVITLRDPVGGLKRAQADAAGRYVVQGLLQGGYTFTARSSLGGVLLRGQPADIQISKGSNDYDYRILAAQ